MLRGNVTIQMYYRAFCLTQKAFFLSGNPPTSLSLGMLNRIPYEALIWCAGLLALAISEGTAHFTLCPLQNLGWDPCPGCGLGRSISLLFHGQVSASLKAHPLGIFAVIILSFRIVKLTKHYLRNYGKSY